MITRNPPGVTHIADDLPRLQLLTGGDADGRTVCIQRFKPAAVVDLDVVAVAAAPTVKTIGNGDGSICGGEDWRTLGAGNVGAGMGANRTGDGVYPVSELRGNRTRNGDRPLQCTGRGAGAVGRHDLFPRPVQNRRAILPTVPHTVGLAGVGKRQLAVSDFWQRLPAGLSAKWAGNRYPNRRW